MLVIKRINVQSFFTWRFGQRAHMRENDLEKHQMPISLNTCLPDKCPTNPKLLENSSTASFPGHEPIKYIMNRVGLLNTHVNEYSQANGLIHIHVNHILGHLLTYWLCCAPRESFPHCSRSSKLSAPSPETSSLWKSASDSANEGPCSVQQFKTTTAHSLNGPWNDLLVDLI